ncbi:MAG: extracellular solute-binding protein, partial [Nitrospira sp. SB0666_bin_27]|nr:extracellular solute-binding protein [Nitrospira sp. SB0666_bin_27]
AGTLERARELQLLQPAAIPDLEETIPGRFRAPDNSWIGLSGRIWVVVYNTTMFRPGDISSILDFADPGWKGKIAIPSAGSVYLQTGVSVIRALKGDEITAGFLRGLKDNAGAFVYGKNRQIVAAVARGEVAAGLVNHYYINRHLAKHPDAPIAPLLTDQGDQGMGVVLNAAGAGITAHTKHLTQARALIRFLISPKGQRTFADVNKEYPLNSRVTAAPELLPLQSFQVASVPLSRLAELRDPTMTVIEDVGLR